MINTLTFYDTSDTLLLKTGDKSQTPYVPNPSSYSVQLSDIDKDSNRATSGLLDRHCIRQGVYTVSVSWDWLSDDQIYALLNAIKAEKFKVKFRDPMSTLSSTNSTGYTTATMYASANKTVEMKTTGDEDTDYWGFSCDFIEY